MGYGTNRIVKQARHIFIKKSLPAYTKNKIAILEMPVYKGLKEFNWECLHFPFIDMLTSN